MGTSGGIKLKVKDDIIQFIDYILNCISNGKYLYYQLSYIPLAKAENKEFLAKLDSKIKEKYQTNKNKNQRLYLRRQNKARFIAVRYQNILLVMRTEGDFENGKNEKWIDIRNNKIELKISEYTTYCVGFVKPKNNKNNKTLSNSVSVTLAADTYNLIKLTCIDAIKYKKSIRKLYYEWNKINGFNGWSGINKQKMQLKEYLVKEVCKEFGIKKRSAEKIFRVNTYRAKVCKTDNKNLTDTLEDVIKEFEFNFEQQNILDSALESEATDTMPVVVQKDEL